MSELVYTPPQQLCATTVDNDSSATLFQLNTLHDRATDDLMSKHVNQNASFCYMAATQKYDDRQRAESNGVDAVHRLLSLMSPNAVRSSLIGVTYPGSGNYSAFAYDGLGRNVLIQEYTSSSLTSTKQFVWADAYRREARDSSSIMTAQYFLGGEIASGTNYLLAGDIRTSVSEMTDSAGAIEAQLVYDPYGRVGQLQGNLAPDFQFASYYTHSRSGLCLSATRAYSSFLGRFLNRDDIEEEGGPNLYAYTFNDPIDDIDPSGEFDNGGTGSPGVDAPVGVTGGGAAAGGAGGLAPLAGAVAGGAIAGGLAGEGMAAAAGMMRIPPVQIPSLPPTAADPKKCPYRTLPRAPRPRPRPNPQPPRHPRPPRRPPGLPPFGPPASPLPKPGGPRPGDPAPGSPGTPENPIPLPPITP